MSTPIFHLVCGCAGVHADGCVLGRAETIAWEAAEVAASRGGHEIVAALAALHEAGLLRNMRDSDPDDLMLGMLDELFQCGLIVVGDCPHATIVQPEAASPFATSPERPMSVEPGLPGKVAQLADLDALTGDLVDRADAVVAQLDAVVNPTRRAA